MSVIKLEKVLVENKTLPSAFLGREVLVDFYLPTNVNRPDQMNLLLINDGQNMEELGLTEMLEECYQGSALEPILAVGIHAGTERKMEYGTASQLDYKGRGAKAADYTRFIFEELIPFIYTEYKIAGFREKAFAGFSLGGLMALDIVWNYPDQFKTAGVFSGSLWWRTRGLDDGYVEDSDRIMHAQIRKGNFHAGQKFFFETGTMDEVMDRNQNGIIDSIDDTMSLIEELEKKGYQNGKDIYYLQL
ncbi:MAG: esterase, partial [Bacteroidetes bacterium]